MNDIVSYRYSLSLQLFPDIPDKRCEHQKIERVELCRDTKSKTMFWYQTAPKWANFPYKNICRLDCCFDFIPRAGNCLKFKNFRKDICVAISARMFQRPVQGGIGNG